MTGVNTSYIHDSSHLKLHLFLALLIVEILREERRQTTLKNSANKILLVIVLSSRLFSDRTAIYNNNTETNVEIYTEETNKNSAKD